jgi:hypothetical protein
VKAPGKTHWRFGFKGFYQAGTPAAEGISSFVQQYASET